MWGEEEGEEGERGVGPLGPLNKPLCLEIGAPINTLTDALRLRGQKVHLYKHTNGLGAGCERGARARSHGARWGK